MKRGIDRRTFLGRSALGALALNLPLNLMAQESLHVTPLRGNLHLISGAGGNVLVAVGPDSVLVVDGGLPGRSDELLEQISRVAQGKPVTTLFNSNWRDEHCGLNYLLGPAGADIIAHENTRLWQNNDFYVEWEDRHYQPMPVEAQANKTFYKTGELAFGGETVAYGFISQFRTDGDIYIHFKESNTLFVGDMMGVGAYPLLDYVTGGWIGGAQKCTKALLEMADTDTVIIPSHGGIQRQAGLDLQQRMLDHAFEQVGEAYRNGRSLEEFLASAPMADYDGIYGNSELFVRLLYRGAWYHVTSRAIRGII